jgi:hypothetical protein
MYEAASFSALTYVPLRLNDVNATLIISEICCVTLALTSAAELVLTSNASSSETSAVSDVSFFLFLLDIDEANDERDANDATDSSSSDLTRFRNPLPIDGMESSTSAGAV